MNKNTNRMVVVTCCIIIITCCLIIIANCALWKLPKQTHNKYDPISEYYSDHRMEDDIFDAIYAVYGNDTVVHVHYNELTGTITYEPLPDYVWDVPEADYYIEVKP